MIKALQKSLLKILGLTPEPDTLVYMLKKGLKIKEVQVEMKEREFGESYLKPLKSAEYMVNMFFSIIFIRALTRKNGIQNKAVKNRWNNEKNQILKLKMEFKNEQGEVKYDFNTQNYTNYIFFNCFYFMRN